MFCAVYFGVPCTCVTRRHPLPAFCSARWLKEAFRLHLVDVSSRPFFGYTLHVLVVIDRGPQFCWWINLVFSYFGHLETLSRLHVISQWGRRPFGRAATSHVQVSSPAKGQLLVSLPSGYRVLPGGGGGSNEAVATRMYVDEVALVEPQCFHSGEWCLRP